MYCFAKICRLCLSHDSVLIHCRARDKNNIPNYYKLKILFPQLITKTSQHFPIWICSKCQEQVNQFYEFKQKCYKSYKLLKKYSLQLFEANKCNNTPDVPTEIFQEVKPIIDHNVISIEEEDHSDNYYNSDDITIVKNELLPCNLKNEPEFNNMIQEIINKNFETIRQIGGADIPNSIKCELSNQPESSNISNERVVQGGEGQENEVQQVKQVSSTVVLENPKEYLQTNVITSTEDTETNTINTLDERAFTLNYTNASFETFASYVVPSVSVPSESAAINNAKNNATNNATNNNATKNNATNNSTNNATKNNATNNATKNNATNTAESVTKNLVNSFTRVLRQRKTISYRNMQKCFYKLDYINKGNAKKTQTKLPAKKQKQLNCSIFKEKPWDDKRKPKKISIIPDSDYIGQKITEQKEKYGVYFCDKCSKEYVRYSTFLLHVSQCRGVVRHQCTLCQKFFASTANLQRHNTTIHMRLKMHCDICHAPYSTYTGLRNHIKRKHI